jgi:hypothetical protein
MKANSTEQEQNQGIKGKVVWLEGNLMPSIGDDPLDVRGESGGVKREIHIHKLTSINQTQQVNGVFFNNIQTEKVKVVTSDEKGNFKAELPPGRYSVFIKEGDKGFFANLFDGHNNINPVTVEENEFKEIKIEINYEASY